MIWNVLCDIQIIMCSPTEDQLCQWRSISKTSHWPLIMTSQCVMTLLGMSHCEITMGVNVARDIHFDVTMSK